MYLLYFLCVQFLLQGLTQGLDSDYSLSLIVTVYRHGDRAPVTLYPTDPNPLSVWPKGLGQLSNIGLREHYELGKFMRLRYAEFLGKEYLPWELHVTSSDVDRCHMSAQAHLAGMYSPQPDEIWNPNLLWRPIPIHSRPIIEDNMLAWGAPCPKYDTLFANVLASDVVRKEEKENKAFYDLVKKEAGLTKESIDRIWKVGDTVFCEMAHNFSQPAWLTKDIKEKLFNLTDFDFQLKYYTDEMKKLTGGPLLGEIVKLLKDRVENSSDERMKFYMFSAHDTTVAGLLSALRTFNGLQPPYTATVILELVSSPDHSFFVRTLYKNDNGSPHPLHLPGCNFPCPWKDFVSLTSPMIPVDWNKECGNTFSIRKLFNWSDTSQLLVMVVLIVIFVILIIVTICICRSSRRRRFSRFRHLDETEKGLLS